MNTTKEKPKNATKPGGNQVGTTTPGSSKTNKKRKVSHKRVITKFYPDHQSKRRDRRRNAGVSAHRPKGAANGKRIGEASHPGPKCNIRDCDHSDCTTLGHFHRPKAHEGAKKRMSEKQRNGSRKPSRYVVCKLHLEAGKCGVKLPHGHCTDCDATAHHHALLTQHIDDTLNESKTDQGHTPSWEFDAFRDRLSDDGTSRHHAQFPDRHAELTSAFRKDEFVFQEVQVQLEEENERGAPTNQPPTAGVSPKLIVAAQSDDEPSHMDEKEESSVGDSSDESDNKHSDTKVTESDDSGNAEGAANTRPVFETKRMLVYLNVKVGEENLTIWKRVKNKVMRHVPFTRMDTVTTINGATDDTVDESLSLRATNETEVKAFWRTRDTPGYRLNSAPGHMALFRDLLPSCVEVEVYTDILSKATRDPKLNKQAVLTKDMTISRALGPIASDYVYSLAGGDSRRNPTTLQWTTIAIMNQLTASAIVKLAAGNGTGLDFQTRGRSRTLR